MAASRPVAAGAGCAGVQWKTVPPVWPVGLKNGFGAAGCALPHAVIDGVPGAVVCLCSWLSLCLCLVLVVGGGFLVVVVVVAPCCADMIWPLTLHVLLAVVGDGWMLGKSLTQCWAPLEAVLLRTWQRATRGGGRGQFSLRSPCPWY